MIDLSLMGRLDCTPDRLFAALGFSRAAGAERARPELIQGPRGVSLGLNMALANCTVAPDDREDLRASRSCHEEQEDCYVT